MSVGSGNGPKTRLELTWIGKDERPRLEPRILLPQTELSYSVGAPSDGGIQDNILIQGDNLLALKALEQEFSGKVKCVYIDPPYNTGSAFGSFYDDGVEHSLWLTLMRDRLDRLRALLSEDGILFVQLDDNEGHYGKVLCDEVFGRANFIATFIWRKVDSPNDNKVAVTPDHEFIFAYAKNIGVADLKQQVATDILEAYRGPDEQGRFYRDRLLKKNGKNSLRTDRPSMWFPIVGPDGKDVYPLHDDGREARWALGKASVDRLVATNEIIWKDRGVDGEQRWVPYTREYAPKNPARPYFTIWNDLHTTRQTKAHQKQLFGAGSEFDTPKPEDLIERLIRLATNEDDIVLDSFAGSGTTGAVAHKMGRRWIMVELGDHATTHIVPRLKKVIDGEDPGGVTEAVGWEGGGGYRFYRLAPSLIEEDQYGQKVISRKYYNPDMLAEAMCKHMGFTYAPSQDPALYWQQGYATERDFIYVTTQSLTYEALMALSMEVGPERTLLVCCKAFRARVSDFPNLTVKKIPQAVLDNCEWGRDDYSLNIGKPYDDDAPEGGDDPDDGGGDGNGGDEPAASRPVRRSTAVSSTEQVQAAPARKVPLKMDGTTRKPRAPKAQAALPVSPAPAAATLSGTHMNGGSHATPSRSPKRKSTTKAAAEPAPLAQSLLPPATKVNGRRPGGGAKTTVSKSKGKKASPSVGAAKKANGQARTKKKAASPGRRRKQTDEKQGELL